MASETIFAYIGPKGSGKSHEGAKRVKEQAKLGRSVVVVNPDFRLDRLAEQIGVPLEDLSRYVRVCDYDALDQPGFWPVEAELKLSRTAEGLLKPGTYWRPDGWRRSFVRAGDVVIVDEAWRWLENSLTIPPAFKVALHMARHWRGPRDWSDPSDVDRYLSDDPQWHPGLGGEKISGGDGTELVSMNIVLLTQDYHALDQKLRRQVDQISDLNSYKTGVVPAWIQKFFPAYRTDGFYGVSTFEGHLLPQNRKSQAYQIARRSFEKLPHLPEIHELMEKAGGQATETRVDDRSSTKNDDRLGHIKYWAWIVGVLALVSCFVAYRSFSKLLHASDPQQQASSNHNSPGSSGSSSSSSSNSYQAPVHGLEKVARIVGSIDGTAIAIGPDGLIRPVDTTALTYTSLGPVGSIDNVTVHKWSAPISSVAPSGDHRGSGIGGPGSAYISKVLGTGPPNSVPGASTTGAEPVSAPSSNPSK